MVDQNEVGTVLTADAHGGAPTRISKPSKLSDCIQKILAMGVPFSDIHISPDNPITLRQTSFAWKMAQIDGAEFIATQEQVEGFIHAMHEGDEERPPGKREPCDWRDKLKIKGSLQPALNLTNLDTGETFRMRCLIQRQGIGESYGLVMRQVPAVPESVQKLGLPFQVESLMTRVAQGLIIVTGPTGSGKSTTLAAMIDEVNRTRCANIVTIEDPVEFIHERKKSIINQREIGIDVKSFADGVLDALRFVPDVILIGEIRDAQTMRQALRAAESGHLVLASMHAPNAISAIRKMLAYLSDSQGDLQSLAPVLEAVIAQALVRDKRGSGNNHLAAEYLDCSEDRVASAIINCVQGDSSYKALSKLEREIITGDGRGKWATSMLDSLTKLIGEGKIDVMNARSVVTTNDEKQALNKLQ